MNCRHRGSLLSIIFFAGAQLTSFASEPVSSPQTPEAQRFEAAKSALQRARLSTYLRLAKNSVNRAWEAWKPPAQGKLLITKTKLTLDSSGKVTHCKILSPSGSEPEDKSVSDCLNGIAFNSLPPGVDSVDLYMTCMADGTMNMVECTDSAEANAYYTNLVGAPLAPNRSNRIRRPGTPIGLNISVPTVQRAAPTVGTVASDPGSYMSDLQRRIKRAWFPPKGDSKRVVVVFKIRPDGSVSNLRLDHSSGVAVADQAALKAVENASPFRPLPATSKGEADIQFTFDYNVFNGGVHGTFRSF